MPGSQMCAFYVRGSTVRARFVRGSSIHVFKDGEPQGSIPQAAVDEIFSHRDFSEQTKASALVAFVGRVLDGGPFEPTDREIERLSGWVRDNP